MLRFVLFTSTCAPAVPHAAERTFPRSAAQRGRCFSSAAVLHVPQVLMPASAFLSKLELQVAEEVQISTDQRVIELKWWTEVDLDSQVTFWCEIFPPEDGAAVWNLVGIILFQGYPKISELLQMQWNQLEVLTSWSAFVKLISVQLK